MSLAVVAGLYAGPLHRSRIGGTLKLLLTSAGVKNPSIHNALVDLLGKPIADSTALCIPTAQYGHPNVGPGQGPWRFIAVDPLADVRPGLEVGRACWSSPRSRASTRSAGSRWSEPDVLLVEGGDALYLCHWMRESGLADLLPSLPETVWVGLSAGSMVMTPRIGEDFVGWKPLSGDDSTLGIVDFSICPHLVPDGCPGNTMAEAEEWVANIARSGVRHRRRDRHPGGGRQGRGRLRGAVETLSLVADERRRAAVSRNLPACEGEQLPMRADGQDWLVAWLGPDEVPAGTRHGAAGVCVGPEDQPS